MEQALLFEHVFKVALAHAVAAGDYRLGAAELGRGAEYDDAGDQRVHALGRELEYAAHELAGIGLGLGEYVAQEIRRIALGPAA